MHLPPGLLSALPNVQSVPSQVAMAISSQAQAKTAKVFTPSQEQDSECLVHNTSPFAQSKIDKVTKAREADGRLLHLVKGVRGSALKLSKDDASECAVMRTLSSESRTRTLLQDVGMALQNAQEGLVTRQLFADLQLGTYKSTKLSLIHI